MQTTRTIPVDVPPRPYEVTVGAGLLPHVGRIVASALGASPGRRAVIITDANVRPLYAEAVADGLAAAGLRTDVIDFPAGERSKNLATYGQVMDRLFALSPAIDRGVLIVALGGGVVGDLAGFVAATALRGLDFVNVPTTLLADVDAAVGGKTGLDAPAGKNLIGAFHQPGAVIIDAGVLKTLPAAETRNGLAECVKHAVIRDASLLDFIESGAEAIAAGDKQVLTELIARNVAIKAAVVAADVRESGERAHLNFGHTLGHAIEAAAGYARISHGQAVSLGMVAACHLAAGRKLIAPSLAQRVCGVLAALGLPVRFADVPDLPSEAADPAILRRVMLHDKKARAGAVRFVLPTRLGAADVFDDVSSEQIDDAVAALSG